MEASVRVKNQRKSHISELLLTHINITFVDYLRGNRRVNVGEEDGSDEDGRDESPTETEVPVKDPAEERLRSPVHPRYVLVESAEKTHFKKMKYLKQTTVHGIGELFFLDPFVIVWPSFKE